jgi:GTPase involved in cell partitioning and DNA repair
VRRELELHGGGIASRPEIVVLSKCDLPGWEEDEAELARACGAKVYPVSAVAGLGLREVLGATARVVQESAEPSQDPDGDLEKGPEEPSKPKGRAKRGSRPDR